MQPTPTMPVTLNNDRTSQSNANPRNISPPKRVLSLPLSDDDDSDEWLPPKDSPIPLIHETSVSRPSLNLSLKGLTHHINEQELSALRIMDSACVIINATSDFVSDAKTLRREWQDYFLSLLGE